MCKHASAIDAMQSLASPVDIDRHAGNQAPTGPVPIPELGEPFELNSAVIEAFPVPNSKLVAAQNYARSLWGKTAKITVELPDGTIKHYFLKTASLGPMGETGCAMIRGEFESLKAIHSISPTFVPSPLACGAYHHHHPPNPNPALSPPRPPTYFLLTTFRPIAAQPPPDPVEFTRRLAALHQDSASPTGKFGFHTTTCHARIPQVTNCWEDSWTRLFQKQLRAAFAVDRAQRELRKQQQYGVETEEEREEKRKWETEFANLAELILNRVIPRLLDPLQDATRGRSIKPCLVHGDLWDENCAVDGETGEPFVFDAGAFYAHNEYELGNWRAVRHRLSARERGYVEAYKRWYQPSEPAEEWDDRNLLYSLRFDLVCAILIPESPQRQVVKDNMQLLCKKFCLEEYRALVEGAAGTEQASV